MTSIETTLPFRRTYILESGRTRRTVEDRTVHLRELDVSDLTKAARSPGGVPILEFGGLALHYIGNTRETASLDALRQHMLRHARFSGGKPYLDGVGIKPKRGIVDDGEAGILSDVARAEADYVVVEGCVGRLHTCGGTRIGIRRFHHAGSGVVFPWLGFPLAHQAQASTVAGDLRGWLADAMPYARVADAPTWEILDAGAVERMAARSEVGQARAWAEALLGYVRDVAGLIDSGAVISFLAVRDAVEAGTADAGLLPLLREAARVLSVARMPDGIDPHAWWTLRLAAVGLSSRLDAMTDPAASPAC